MTRLLISALRHILGYGVVVPILLLAIAVQTLIFDIDGSSPGHVDAGTGTFRMSDGSDATNYDVVDEVVGPVILHGGEVVGVRKHDLPDRSSSVAALLRYLV